MAAGVRGRLVTATFTDNFLHTVPGADPPPAHFARALDAWADRREAAAGPASSVRTLADGVVIPLLRILGFTLMSRVDHGTASVLTLRCGTDLLPVVVVGWDDSLRRAWRPTVLGGVRSDARWGFCSNGRVLRIVDAQHTWAREYLEFDLALLPHEPEAQRVLWALVRADACSTVPPVLEVAVAASARQGVAVCRALGDGVLEALACLLQALHAAPSRGESDALRCRRPHSVESDAVRRARPAVPGDAFEQCLTVLYRILFLLFAEARALVPMWHPVYRERYTIDAIVSTLLSGRPYRGVWQAVNAISRLAHAGCSAGELKVTAFNGRLFAPARASAFHGARFDDDVMAQAVLAVSTTTFGRGSVRARIAYRDLDVEQLGAVYEHVLEYEPAASNRAILNRSRDTRKATGSFYTPRSLTDFLVRQTLAPLTAERSSAELLSLRIVDPAMGSGAFLVAACRYLAEVAEEARVREGLWHPADVTAADRAALRRDIAQRCLFGVDVNPMAVQLARLSIWLATLAADKPLTFLDHHLVAGNSLVGATPDDVRRQPSRRRRGVARSSRLPLFDDATLAPVIEHAVRTRLHLASEPDDQPQIVRRKEQALAALQSRGAPLHAWSRLLDVWCAGWFWPDEDPPGAGAFGEICNHLLGQPCALPHRVVSALAARADTAAADHAFLHWPLTFPEVFADEQGAPLPNAGFDAVIGNPPWDMVRGDAGESHVRQGRRHDARRLTDFVREAGIYRVEAGAHVNRYHLFLERALQLTRRGGRIGLVLPSGVVTDSGAAALRRHVFDHSDVDTLTGFDNRHGIFPIHRSVRFVLLTATAGRPTTQVACRFGATRVEELDAATERRPAPLLLTRRLLTRLSGEDDLGVPELLTAHDLAIVVNIVSDIPRLGSARGWNVRFGRELNATDDRGAFARFSGSATARPVLAGKQIEPFRAFPERSRFELPLDSGTSARVPRRARLAYRDVASATNRVTLIAAIVPARCVTTHTLFCLKTPLPLDAQHVLCALLNSFVANYLVRLRVNTHVAASLLARVPVPVVSERDPVFDRLAALSRTLSTAATPADHCPEYAELQAIVGRLYGLDVTAFERILHTFPLIATEIKSAVLARFSNLHRSRHTEAPRH